MAEFSTIELKKVDSDDVANDELLREYDIRSIPTLIMLDADGKVLGKIIGAQSETSLRNWITSFI
jgi:thioredoxin-like negative regulator of GroEL